MQCVTVFPLQSARWKQMVNSNIVILQMVNSNIGKLVTFTGEKIKTLGRALFECEFKDKFHVLEFQV